MQSKTALALFAAIACPLVLGCSAPATGDAKTVASKDAALRRTQSCEDLTLALREDARSKLNGRIDAEVRAIREGYSYYYGGRGGPVLEGPGFAEGAVPAATAGAVADDASSTPAHSDTETQVKGVDEAD